MEVLVFNKPLFLLWWHTTYPQSLFALIISFSPNFIRPGNWSVHTAAHSRSLQSGGLSDPPRACLQPHPNWNYRRYRKNSCLGSRKILFFGVELWAVVFKLDCLIMNPSSFPFVLSKVVKKGQRQFTLLHFRLTRALLSPMEVCALYSKPCLFFLLKMIYSPPPFFFAEAFNLLYLEPTEREGVEILTFETSRYLLSWVVKGQMGKELLGGLCPSGKALWDSLANPVLNGFSFYLPKKPQVF